MRKPATTLARIGRLVKSQRVLKGWTQEQLARRAGLHRTFVSGVERGDRNLSILSLEALADALDVTLGSLIGPGK